MGDSDRSVLFPLPKSAPLSPVLWPLGQRDNRPVAPFLESGKIDKPYATLPAPEILHLVVFGIEPEAATLLLTETQNSFGVLGWKEDPVPCYTKQ